ncbi:hypothetical protein BDZ89DRAFT_943451 [Hymenopellis radicata]|nr:hypothetical protein BDZ89DRAFT_943451 [Hymenopellis radicata]
MPPKKRKNTDPAEAPGPKKKKKSPATAPVVKKPKNAVIEVSDDEDTEQPGKKPKSRSDDIDWVSNNATNVWLVLTEMERDVNMVVIVGLKPGQKTSGDSKKDAYHRIAAAVFPERHLADRDSTMKRVKLRVEKLIKEYKYHAAKLRVTGGGINDVSEEDDTSGDIVMKFYIGQDGPTDDTPEEGVNLWSMSFGPFLCLFRYDTQMQLTKSSLTLLASMLCTPQGRTSTRQPLPEG